MNKEELREKIAHLPINVALKRYLVLDLIDQLEEPEKPVVPSYVAEWIEVNKKYYSLSTLLRHKALKQESDELYQWVVIKDNEEVICRAWFEGYTVEEKKYQVIFKDGGIIRLFLCKNGDTVVMGTNGDYIEKCPYVTHLTEKEIKDYDERFWPFAKPVQP